METGNENPNEQQQVKNTQEPAATPKDEKVEEALKQAEQDIEQDPDFKSNPNDDLDEGEFARLGNDDETDLTKE